jgi:hypothetical protein
MKNKTKDNLIEIIAIIANMSIMIYAVICAGWHGGIALFLGELLTMAYLMTLEKLDRSKQ